MPHCAEHLRQLSLTSVEGMSTSDHKPVRSVFEIAPTQHLQYTRGVARVLLFSKLTLLPAEKFKGCYVTVLSSPLGVLAKYKGRPPCFKAKSLDKVLQTRVLSKTQLTNCTLILVFHTRRYFNFKYKLGTASVRCTATSDSQNFTATVYKYGVREGTLEGSFSTANGAHTKPPNYYKMLTDGMKKAVVPNRAETHSRI